MSKMSKVFRGITVSLALSVFALVLCAGVAPLHTAQAAKPVEWVAYSTWPEGNHNSVGLIEFAKRVEEATGGRLKMTVHTGAALGYKGTEILSVVRDGLVQVSDMSMGNVAGEEPVFTITTLPFLLKNMEEGYTLNKLAREDYDKLLAGKWNQRILYSAPWPMAGFFTQKEVRSIGDLKGMKMRTYDRNTGLVVEATGGTPYPLPFADVYSALATGAIDSCLTSTPTGVDGKFWEVLKYFTPTNVAMTQDIVTVNLKAFNKLDKDVQEILLRLGNEMQTEMWEKVGPALHTSKEKICVDKGIVVVEPDAKFIADLYDATQKIREDWLASAPPVAKTVIEKFNKATGKN